MGTLHVLMSNICFGSHIKGIWIGARAGCAGWSPLGLATPIPRPIISSPHRRPRRYRLVQRSPRRRVCHSSHAYPAYPHQRLGYEDYWIYFAFLIKIINAILQTLQTRHLYYLDRANVGLEPSGATLDSILGLKENGEYAQLSSDLRIVGFLKPLCHGDQ